MSLINIFKKRGEDLAAFTTGTVATPDNNQLLEILQDAGIGDGTSEGLSKMVTALLLTILSRYLIVGINKVPRIVKSLFTKKSSDETK